MERKVDVNASKAASASDQITEGEKRKALKARVAEVLDRGVIGDRLHVDVPAGMHGEWVHKDDVTKKKALGFQVAPRDFAPDKALHDAGDNSLRVGDVVFMTCAMETKEVIDEVKKERFNAVHAPKKGGKQKEEADFEQQVDVITQPSANSTVKKAGLQDITSAIDAVNRQKTQG